MRNHHEVFAPEPTPSWPLLHFGSTFSLQVCAVWAPGAQTRQLALGDFLKLTWFPALEIFLP